MAVYKSATTLAFATCIALSSCSKPVTHEEQAEAHGHGGKEATQHWGYTGEVGPDHWSQLGSENEVCAVGLRQSPINLSGAQKQQFSRISLDYKPSLATIQNNGHTIQVAPSNGGGITLDGVRYNLKQFHFHTPSEHALNGRQTVLETHFVHQNDKGEYLVVGVLSELGVADPVLASLWTYLPTDSGKPLPIADLLVNPKDLMPTTEDFYVYAGSLTTPPCTEGVTWLVFTSTLNVSTEQADSLAQLFGTNARPLQARNERDFIHLSGS